MNNVYNKLKIIDIYGLSYSLRYNGSFRFQGLIGIILTIISFLSIIIISCIYLANIFKHKSFSIIVSENPIIGKKNIDLSEIPFMIGFLNGVTPQEIDETYVSITLDKNVHTVATNEEGKLTFNRESTKIELEKCKSDHLYGLGSYFEKTNYENFLCPIPGQNLSFAGRNGDTINGYDLLEIHLSKCENSSDKICKTDDEIVSYLDNTNINVYYLEKSVNHYNISNPIEYFVRSEIFMISTFVLKRYYYYFTHGVYESDKGIIFESISEWNFYEYSRTIADFVDSEKQSYYSSSTIIEINFTCSNINKTYRREYAKITNFFGLVSGIFSFFSIVSQIICNYFYEKLFILNFSNSFVKDKKALFKKFTNKFSHNNDNKYLYELNKKNMKSKFASESSTIKTNSILKKNHESILNNSKNYKEKYEKNFIRRKKIECDKLETERNLDLYQKTTDIINKINKNRKKNNYKYQDYGIVKFNKKDYLKFFKLYLYKYMSLELIIPTLEKLNCKIYNVKNIFNHRASNQMYVRNSGRFLDNLKYS